MTEPYDTVHAHTHELRPTLKREEASEEAKELWTQLQSIFKNEEAWYIIDHYLSLERLKGHIDGADYDPRFLADVRGKGHSDCSTEQDDCKTESGAGEVKDGAV